MKVLTIYNHGTGGSSKKSADKGEIVNIFGNSARAMNPEQEGNTFIITEGVGQTGSPHTTQMVRKPLTNSMEPVPVPYSRERRKTLLTQITGSTIGARVLEVLPEDALLQITGEGVDQNVISVVNRISNLNITGKRPEKINMMGWSRGAVTCIRIAHILNTDKSLNLSDIPINIFAVDPVPGKGHEYEIDARTIGPNIKNFVATLSMHEGRSGFADLLYKFRVGTQFNRLILPMPGIHRDTAKHDNGVGKITFHLCAKFLSYHGTELSPIVRKYIINNNEEIANEYEKIFSYSKETNVHYKQSIKELITGGSPIKHTRPVLNDYTHQEYVNAHHAAIIKNLRPNQNINSSMMKDIGGYLSHTNIFAVRYCGLL